MERAATLRAAKLREEILETVLAFNSTGLSCGKSGNVSVLTEGGFLITPTGIAYDEMLARDIVELDTEGMIIKGRLQPSSEWHIHRDIYVSRVEVNAIVHVHSPYATAIACTRQDIPAFHYMVAVAGGDSIRCAEYATFGTEALSKNAIAALKGRYACLLANHGMITLGEDIQSAFNLALQVEDLAKQYWLSSQFGEPVILDEEEMRINLEKFKTYGKQEK